MRSCQIHALFILAFVLQAHVGAFRLSHRQQTKVQRRNLKNNTRKPVAVDLTRTLCMRAWQTDQYFPPKDYSSYTVRRPAGLTLDELKFAAVRRVRIQSVDADVSGSFEKGVLSLTVGGKLSCNHVGPPSKSTTTCAQMNLVLSDLDMQGASITDRLALKGENTVAVALSMKVSMRRLEQHASPLKVDEINVKVLELGDGFVSNSILRRVMNTGLVRVLITQAVSVNLLTLLEHTPALSFLPKFSFSARLAPSDPHCDDCNDKYSFFNIVDMNVGMDVSTADFLQADMESRAQVDNPEFLLSAPLIALSLEMPQLLSKALTHVGMASTLGLSSRPFSPSVGKLLEATVNGNLGMNIVPLLTRVRDLMSLHAHPAFASNHPEDPETNADSPKLDWLNLGLLDPSVGSLTSVAFKGLEANMDGKLTISNSGATGIKLEAEDLNLKLGIARFDCSILESYLEAWVDKGDWPGFDMCSFLGGTLSMHASASFDAAFDTRTGRISVCLSAPCGNRPDFKEPQIGLIVASPNIPELHMYPSGKWVVNINWLAILGVVRNMLREITMMESSRGPSPVAPEIAQSLQGALESVECFGAGPLASLSKMASQSIFDNMLGQNLQWTPSFERIGEDRKKIEKLEKEYDKPGARYLIGRLNPRDGRVSGRIDAVGWDDEEVTLDSVIRISAATPEALSKLGLRPDEGDYIVRLRGIDGPASFVKPSIGLLNPKSTDTDMSRLFSWTSVAHGEGGNKLFKVTLGFKLTLVMKDRKLIGCLPKVGGCCAKSVKLETPTFEGGSVWTTIANGLGSLGDSLFGNFLKDFLGHGLPKFLEPVIYKALGSVDVNEDDQFRSLTMQLHVESNLRDDEIRIRVDPALKSKTHRKILEPKSSSHRLKLAEKLKVSLDTGLLQLDYKPAALLAKTLYGRLDLESFGTISFPFDARMDTNLNLLGSIPDASSSFPWASFLNNMEELMAQPQEYWDRLSFESGIVPVGALMDFYSNPDKCKLERPTRSRRLNRNIDFSKLIDFNGFHSINSIVSMTVQKSGGLHKITVASEKISVIVDLDKTLPAITNDPGSTEFYYADYNAGKFVVNGYPKNVRVRCGSLAFDDSIDDGILVGLDPQKVVLDNGGFVSDGGLDCVSVRKRQICGDADAVQELFDVLQEELWLQSVNSAKLADPSCQHLNQVPDEATAFGALDPHVSQSYHWSGFMGNLSDSKFRGLGEKDLEKVAVEGNVCHTQCGAHPACTSTDVAVFRQDEKAYPVCQYSHKPLGPGFLKQWHVVP